jgi:hypothetical protein
MREAIDRFIAELHEAPLRKQLEAGAAPVMMRPRMIR